MNQLEQETPLELGIKVLYESVCQQFQGNSFDKLREKSWDRFLEVGLPTRHNEAFNYVRLTTFNNQPYTTANASEIDSQTIHKEILPECRHSYLVFVNGIFQPQYSNTEALPKSLVILKLKDAMRTYGTLLNNHWQKWLKEEKDSLALLNGALHQEGLFIYVPPKMAIATPIQVLNIIDSENPIWVLPRLQVFVGAHGVLSVTLSQKVFSGESYGVNGFCDFTLEDGANVQFTQVTCNENPSTWHFESLRAILKRNSVFKSVSATEGSATVRSDYRIVLAGENAEALLNGVAMLANKNEAHTHIVIEHQAPHCRSLQLFKNVVSDVGRSSFEGKIHVHQIAQKTEAFQLNNNLLLNEHAFAYSKPNLEIFADDVKASHGSTVGQLDEEQLFYLKTRGFPEVEAKNLLIYGFCKEVIDKIPLHSLVETISSRARQFSKHSVKK